MQTQLHVAFIIECAVASDYYARERAGTLTLA